jgi:hypothetical protein
LFPLELLDPLPLELFPPPAPEDEPDGVEEPDDSDDSPDSDDALAAGGNVMSARYHRRPSESTF